MTISGSFYDENGHGVFMTDPIDCFKLFREYVYPLKPPDVTPEEAAAVVALFERGVFADVDAVRKALKEAQP